MLFEFSPTSTVRFPQATSWSFCQDKSENHGRRRIYGSSAGSLMWVPGIIEIVS